MGVNFPGSWQVQMKGASRGKAPMSRMTTGSQGTYRASSLTRTSYGNKHRLRGGSTAARPRQARPGP